MNRIVFIDVAKAICIILVVIGHFFPDGSPEWYVAIHDIIYTFHMPLFMFVSGYVYIVTKRQTAYGTFLSKKLKRLIVPYITTSIIVITIKILTQGGLNVEHPVTALSYLRIFYLPEAGYFLWFIWALWWMFVLIPLFDTHKKRLILFFFSIALHYIPLSFPHVFCLYEFKRMLIYFMLGIVCFEQEWLRNFVCSFKPAKTVFAISLFLAVKYANIYTVGDNRMVNVLPYVGIFAIIEISKLVCHLYKIDEGSRIMLLSASSYIIYLFHTTFEGFAKAIF